MWNRPEIMMFLLSFAHFFILFEKWDFSSSRKKCVRLNWKGGFWWLFVNQVGGILVFTTLFLGRSATNIAAQNFCLRTLIWPKLRFSFWPNPSFSHHACNWLACVHTILMDGLQPSWPICQWHFFENRKKDHLTKTARCEVDKGKNWWIFHWFDSLLGGKFI